MATPSDKAKRAAATKAFNQRQQELDDQALIESTRQPRQAKSKALEAAVWNGPKGSGTSQKRAASQEDPSRERAPKKTKSSASVPQEKHPGKLGSKQASSVKRKQTRTLKQTKRLPPAAAQIEESESEQLELEDQVIRPPKFRARGGTKYKVPLVALTDDSEPGNTQDSESGSNGGSADSSQNSDSGEDDFSSIGNKDLRKVLSDELPAILEPGAKEKSVESLFDNDNDLQIEVIQKSGDEDDHNIDMSNHHSVPPTTDTDGDIAMPDNEDSNPEVNHWSNSQQQSSKQSVRRQKAFLAEKPIIKKNVSGNTKKEKRLESESTSASSNIECQWPQHAKLVLPSAGKSLLLNNQHVYIGHVVRRAIAKLTEETLLIDAFLDVDKKINYHRRLLIDTAHKLMSEIHPIEDIHDRLKEDMGFCDALGKLVTDRLSTIRGPVKMHALVEIAAYELGKGDKCVERVEALLDRLVFIFPGSWTIDNKTKKEQWNFKANKPFLNSVIIDVIRLSFFNSLRGIGYQIIKKCVSTLDGHNEPELPMGLVALACTGIYAALDEWKTGSKVISKFEGNVFATIYKAICRNLDGIKAQNPKAYHIIMAELYMNAVTKATAPSESDNALQVMDLTGF